MLFGLPQVLGPWGGGAGGGGNFGCPSECFGQSVFQLLLALGECIFKRQDALGFGFAGCGCNHGFVQGGGHQELDEVLFVSWVGALGPPDACYLAEWRRPRMYEALHNVVSARAVG